MSFSTSPSMTPMCITRAMTSCSWGPSRLRSKLGGLGAVALRVGLLSVALAPTHAAERFREAIVLEYAAPSGCGTDGEFLARVDERIGVRRARAGELARHFRVTIESRGSEGTELWGTLVVIGPEGASAPREVR